GVCYTDGVSFVHNPSPLEKRLADSLPDKSFSRIGRRMPDEGRLRDDGKRENLNFSNTDSINKPVLFVFLCSKLRSNKI
ncbi:MAG: hypothetical protein NT023_22330, partial [Armatimonadetes bacterium]|nr:hypothetical protein [Armatimonadota bacterium]